MRTHYIARIEGDEAREDCLEPLATVWAKLPSRPAPSIAMSPESDRGQFSFYSPPVSPMSLSSPEDYFSPSNSSRAGGPFASMASPDPAASLGRAYKRNKRSDSLASSHFASSPTEKTPFVKSASTFAFETSARVHSDHPESHVLVTSQRPSKGDWQLHGTKDHLGNKVTEGTGDEEYRVWDVVSFAGTDAIPRQFFEVFVFDWGRIALDTGQGRGQAVTRMGFSSPQWERVGHHLFFDPLSDMQQTAPCVA